MFEANQALSEAVIMGKINCDQVVKFQDIFLEPHESSNSYWLCIVMDYYKLGDLATNLGRIDETVKKKISKIEKNYFIKSLNYNTCTKCWLEHLQFTL